MWAYTLFEKGDRGASEKQPVFLLHFACNCEQNGMLKHDGVYIQIVKNCSTSELIPILSNIALLFIQIARGLMMD